MDLVRNLISLGRMVREEAKIKVRQPLREIYLDNKTKDTLGNLTDLIKEELNVKTIVFIKDINKYMTLDVKPNFKEVGKVFGPKINLFKSFLETLSDEDRLSLNENNSINVVFDSEDLVITQEMVSISVNPKVGFNIGKEGNNYVILNTTLDESLLNEGLAREIVSKIQNIRKEKDFDVADRISIKYYGDDEVLKAIKEFSDYIKDETLTINLELNELTKEEYKVNDNTIYLNIEK